MSKRLAVSKAAQSDINHIYDYTLAIWGSEQADDYITRLEYTLNAAAADDKALLSFSEWRPNARCFFVGKQTVFLLDEALSYWWLVYCIKTVNIRDIWQAADT